MDGTVDAASHLGNVMKCNVPSPFQYPDTRLEAALSPATLWHQRTKHLSFKTCMLLHTRLVFVAI